MKTNLFKALLAMALLAFAADVYGQNKEESSDPDVMDASSVSAHVTGAVGFSAPPQILGTQLRAARSIRIPHDLNGKKFNADRSRVVLRTYLIDNEKDDTLAVDTYAYEGSKYRVAKQKQRGYSIENDAFYPYLVPSDYSLDNYSVTWRDTIDLDYPEQMVCVKGKIQIFNLKDQLLYEKDSMSFASSRMRRPMKLLEYTFGAYELDREAYHVRPRAETKDAKGNLALNFLVNQAVVDPADAESMDALNGLKNELLDIMSGDNTRLLEFSMNSISSPDGPFEKNLSLAQQRLRYASDQVWAPLPDRYKQRVYRPGNKAVVATWADVADSLETEGLKTEAEEVRGIVSRFEGNKDRQWQEVRKLSYYNEKITPVLERMRRIEFSYKYDELRALTTEEILSLYYNAPDYRSGSKHFTVSQYWNLFKALEDGGADAEELTAVYKRACRETKEDNGRTWIYAANKYAVACIEKGIADTMVLAPHIDRRFKCNYGRDKMGNPKEVVANQLRMYLMSNDFYNASIMALMLPDTEEFKMLKAYTMCLGGYYQGGVTEEEKAQRAEWANIVMESSPRNKVVMLLAMNTRSHTLKAEQELANWPENDPLTWYFKAVISCRKNSYPNADFMEPMYFEEYIKTCFDMDKKYIAIAREDGDIDEDMLKEFFKFNPEYDKF